MSMWQLQANESLSGLTEDATFLLADMVKATGGNVETIPNFDGSYDLDIEGTLVTDSHHVGTRIIKLIRDAGGSRKLILQQINHSRKKGGYRRH